MSRFIGMKIDPGSLEDLKRISAKYLQKELSDSEAQNIGQRIVRFLMNSERGFSRPARDIDAR